MEHHGGPQGIFQGIRGFRSDLVQFVHTWTWRQYQWFGPSLVPYQVPKSPLFASQCSHRFLTCRLANLGIYFTVN